MVKRRRIELAPVRRGDNIVFPIPVVGRGRGDTRNSPAVILNRSEKSNSTLPTKHGILKETRSRSVFELCPENLSDVN